MKSVIDFANLIKAYAAAGKTIAPVENGTTVVGSYAIGEKFIREGVLYKAKTAITAGDTLTLNTNYELADNLDTQLSNVKQALSNEVATRAALGAHNLLPFPFDNMSGTYYSVPFTIAADGLITASGTASSSGMNMALATSLSFDVGEYKVKLFGSISGGVARFRDATAGITYGDITSSVSEIRFSITEETKNHRFAFYFNAGINAEFSVNGRFAIFLANDPYDEYTMYAPTNSQLLSYKDNGVLGAKNLLPLSLSEIKALNTSGTWSGNAYTVNGKTFTVNTDGNGNVLSIVLSGTASAGTEFLLHRGYELPSGTYIFSKDNTSATEFFIKKLNGSVHTVIGTLATITTAGYAECTVDYGGYDHLVYGLFCANGSALTDTIKPMTRLATDSDSTYQPYAMTNKELTDALTYKALREYETWTTTKPALGINIPSNCRKLCFVYTPPSNVSGFVEVDYDVLKSITPQNITLQAGASGTYAVIAFNSAKSQISNLITYYNSSDVTTEGYSKGWAVYYK